MRFNLESQYKPAGDQPTAIRALTESIEQNKKNLVLLGVTGSGKTFTMANIIQNTGKPTLIMAPNKILAAQLYGEMKDFFPNNAVGYFVSYYDYYQPEAYIPRSDTFIEKTATINEQIDRMRHEATQFLLERRDAIVVASVSCIYGIGSVETYQAMTFALQKGENFSMNKLKSKLVDLQYHRNEMNFQRGKFRIRGDICEIFPSHYADCAWRISFFGDEIESIDEFDPLTGEKYASLDKIKIYANSHYVTPQYTIKQAMKQIRKDLAIRLQEFEAEGKIVEAQRLKSRTEFDLESLEATNMCNGIENYSRYLTGRAPGEPPPTLYEYLPNDALLIVDESHVGVPQIGGMYRGDRARKLTLSEHGFRLPSCLDNRPLKFEEWDALRPTTLFVSATPGKFEMEIKEVLAEQVVRPTGLIDPTIEIRPTKNQIDDLIGEINKVIADQNRILVTVLTKKMAEALTDYLQELNYKVKYMHSEIETLERIEIISGLRKGEFDILVGINLLREGLDIPEVELVAIMDADKAGFLRSQMSLIQTIGRAARNVNGRVIMYADHITDAMEKAIGETNRRREKQIAYNTLHGITPKTIISKIKASFDHVQQRESKKNKDIEIEETNIKKLTKMMYDAAENLDFEKAAAIRNKIESLS